MAEGNEKLLKKNGVKKLVVRIIFLKDYFGCSIKLKGYNTECRRTIREAMAVIQRRGGEI